MNEPNERWGRWVALCLIVFVTLWGWVHRDRIVPASWLAPEDIELVKSGAFPDSLFTPIGAAFQAVCKSPNWQSFVSVKGIHVVQVEGELESEDIAQILREKLYDADFVCKQLPAVSKFLGKDFSNLQPIQFLAAIRDPENNPEIVLQEGFENASREYLTANKAHFSAKVHFKTEFLFKVTRLPSEILKSETNYVTGYSGIIFSSGPYAGQELKYNEFSSLVSAM